MFATIATRLTISGLVLATRASIAHRFRGHGGVRSSDTVGADSLESGRSVGGAGNAVFANREAGNIGEGARQAVIASGLSSRVLELAQRAVLALDLRRRVLVCAGGALNARRKTSGTGIVAGKAVRATALASGALGLAGGAHRARLIARRTPLAGVARIAGTLARKCLGLAAITVVALGQVGVANAGDGETQGLDRTGETGVAGASEVAAASLAGVSGVADLAVQARVPTGVRLVLASRARRADNLLVLVVVIAVGTIVARGLASLVLGLARRAVRAEMLGLGRLECANRAVGASVRLHNRGMRAGRAILALVLGSVALELADGAKPASDVLDQGVPALGAVLARQLASSRRKLTVRAAGARGFPVVSVGVQLHLELAGGAIWARTRRGGTAAPGSRVSSKTMGGIEDATAETEFAARAHIASVTVRLARNALELAGRAGNARGLLGHVREFTRGAYLATATEAVGEIFELAGRAQGTSGVGGAGGVLACTARVTHGRFNTGGVLAAITVCAGASAERGRSRVGPELADFALRARGVPSARRLLELAVRTNVARARAVASAADARSAATGSECAAVGARKATLAGNQILDVGVRTLAAILARGGASTILVLALRALEASNQTKLARGSVLTGRARRAAGAQLVAGSGGIKFALSALCALVIPSAGNANDLVRTLGAKAASARRASRATSQNFATGARSAAFARAHATHAAELELAARASCARGVGGATGEFAGSARGTSSLFECVVELAARAVLTMFLAVEVLVRATRAVGTGLLSHRVGVCPRVALFALELANGVLVVALGAISASCLLGRRPLANGTIRARGRAHKIGGRVRVVELTLCTVRALFAHSLDCKVQLLQAVSRFPRVASGLCGLELAVRADGACAVGGTAALVTELAVGAVLAGVASCPSSRRLVFADGAVRAGGLPRNIGASSAHVAVDAARADASKAVIVLTGDAVVAEVLSNDMLVGASWAMWALFVGRAWGVPAGVAVLALELAVQRVVLAIRAVGTCGVANLGELAGHAGEALGAAHLRGVGALAAGVALGVPRQAGAVGGTCTGLVIAHGAVLACAGLVVTASGD